MEDLPQVEFAVAYQAPKKEVRFFKVKDHSRLFVIQDKLKRRIPSAVTMVLKRELGVKGREI